MRRKIVVAFMLIAVPCLLFGQNYEFKKMKKLGHAAPALFDWNNDGLNDLIILLSGENLDRISVHHFCTKTRHIKYHCTPHKLFSLNA